MRPLVAPQAKARTQVRLQIRRLLDISHERLVHLLVLYPLRIRVLLLRRRLAVLEEVVLAFALYLLARPVLVLAHALDDVGVHARNVNDGRCGDHVAVVDAAQRNAIALEGAGDEENALLELAQEDDALASESAGEEDQDGAGCERVAVLGGVCGFAGL